jgi:hypothetical protein
MCRTCRLPAKSRFLGYMTNNGKTGDIAPYTKETYDTGIPERQARESASESNEEMRLVYTENKDRDETCTAELLKPDYKDYYYSHVNDGLTKLVFPNEAEKIAYGYESSKFQGLLMICLAACAWGKCRAGDLREADFGEGTDENPGGLEMFVNGKEVKSLANIGSGAFLLVGEDGDGHWEPSSNGDYEIGVRAKRPNSYVRISAIVLY